MRRRRFLFVKYGESRLGPAPQPKGLNGAIWPKIAQLFLIPADVISIHSENFPMRIAQSIFTGSVAVLAAIASPAFATGSSPNSHVSASTGATGEEPSSAGCQAYQKAADGSWVQMACHEGAETAPAPVRHARSASHHPVGETATR